MRRGVGDMLSLILYLGITHLSWFPLSCAHIGYTCLVSAPLKVLEISQHFVFNHGFLWAHHFVQSEFWQPLELWGEFALLHPAGGTLRRSSGLSRPPLFGRPLHSFWRRAGGSLLWGTRVLLVPHPGKWRTSLLLLGPNASSLSSFGVQGAGHSLGNLWLSAVATSCQFSPTN